MKVSEDGSVVFHSELKKMDIEIENAERIFEEALQVLEGNEPKESEECEWCKYKEQVSKE